MNRPGVAVGVDLGGTTFAVGILTANGRLLASSSHRTPAGDEAGTLCDVVAAAITSTLLDSGYAAADVAGVGIGVPGRVEPETGRIIQCPNLHALDGVNIQEALMERVEGIRHVFVANDAEIATLGELRYGAGREVENLVLLTLGTGIGGGVAFGNRVVRGPRRILGEIGHITVDPYSRRRCGCGNLGCFETTAAKRAIIDTAVYELAWGRASSVIELAGHDIARITPEIIAEAAWAGDALALEVYRQVGHWIGIAISSIIVLTDPDLVLLGGGIAAAGNVLLEPVRRTVAMRSRISGFDPNNVVLAQLGNEAGMYGAGALVGEQT